ncbi:hypothetical protein RIN58_07250 [Siccibacter colletis]|uniref:hypothetical protein n=1 Tax=Siccibacter colletis TaxID=1505757 RepID=UPI0028BEEEF0|nr:hypothetical protein [Siccibacter colletis]WNN49888.1 hypothetical protein RIN58_07250 [Siccibacter colletis]
MEDYGALISLANGATFITPQSTPLCLYAMRTFSSRKVNDALNQAVGSISVPDPGQPIIPFVHTNKPSQGNVGMIAERNSSGITVTGNNVIGNGSFTMTVLLFTFFEQPMPNPPYGMAVWDESGKLILTHESKVLTDIETVGTRGISGGTSLNVKKSGRWAIVPDCSGQQQWQFSSGGPGGIVISMNTGFAAEYNGSSTQIHSALLQYPGGSGQLVGAVNAGNTVTAIDVSKYI